MTNRTWRTLNAASLYRMTGKASDEESASSAASGLHLQSAGGDVAAVVDAVEVDVVQPGVGTQRGGL